MPGTNPPPIPPFSLLPLALLLLDTVNLSPEFLGTLIRLLFKTFLCDYDVVMNPKISGRLNTWAWHHTGIAVREIDRVIDYYATNLGFEVVFEARNMTELISGITGVKGLRPPCTDQVAN